MTGNCAAFLLFWRALPGNDSSPKRSTYFGNLFDLDCENLTFKFNALIMSNLIEIQEAIEQLTF
jgi:hypothetical protein